MADVILDQFGKDKKLNRIPMRSNSGWTKNRYAAES